MKKTRLYKIIERSLDPDVLISNYMLKTRASGKKSWKSVYKAYKKRHIKRYNCNVLKLPDYKTFRCKSDILQVFPNASLWQLPFISVFFK